MAEVIKFGEKNNTSESNINIEEEILRQNKMYIDNVRAKAKIEHDALVRTGNEQAIQLGSVIYKIIDSIATSVDEALESYNIVGKIQAPYFLNQCMQSVNAILAGGVISPITGDDEEWVDTTVPEDIGKEFTFEYRGKEHTITINSVQVNKRYPKIYRLNNDNDLAHRIDYFQFHDAKNPAKVHLTEDSIRFIQFPYTMQALHSHCIVDDRTISDYLDFDYSEIKDGLIYPDQSNDAPDSYVIAPKMPFSMLEENGIIIEEEIEKYLNYVNSNNFELSEEYDDDLSDFGNLHQDFNEDEE